MKKEIIDNTLGYDDFDDFRDQKKLFIFYKYFKDSYIVIYAESYLEAMALLCSFNPNAKSIYNLNEYKLLYVNAQKLFNICKISPEWESTPMFINKNDYLKLEKYIYNLNDSKINHTKTLSKNIIDKMKEA